MSQDSLAIKYRPKIFDDVIGQKVIIQSLTNAFKNNTLHHSYIFGGKFGCGKTTTARILAAMLNDPSGATMTPDISNPIVEAIFRGKSLDVKELDAASNRGVDDIRELAKESRYAPVECRHKIFIIDEAHSLTGIAAEAMLKLVEEPPPNVMFIFCTTDPQLLKDTIHSRSIPFKFHKVAWNEIATHLEMVAKQEGLTYEEDAIKIAARASDGSVRNGLQNLQTLINYCGDENITAEQAKEVLGAIDDSLFFSLVDCVIKIDTPRGMQVINGMMRDGRRASEVVNGFNKHLRNLMISRSCGNDLSIFGFSDEEIKRLNHQGSGAGIELIIEMMSLVVDINRGLSLSLDPQVLFEKFLVQSIMVKTKLSAKRKIAAG